MDYKHFNPQRLILSQNILSSIHTVQIFQIIFSYLKYVTHVSNEFENGGKSLACTNYANSRCKMGVEPVKTRRVYQGSEERVRREVTSSLPAYFAMLREKMILRKVPPSKLNCHARGGEKSEKNPPSRRVFASQ